MSDPPTTALVAALFAAIVISIVLGWFCYRLLVDRGRLLLRMDDETSAIHGADRLPGLPTGAYLSDFALPILAGSVDSSRVGTMATLSEFSSRPLLIVFLRADCLFSRAFAHELAGSETNPDAPFLVSILVGESANQGAEALFATLPGVVLHDPYRQVARLMRVGATPCGYLVDAGRRTASPMLVGPEALLAAAGGDTPSDSDSPPQAITPLPSASANLRPPLPVGSPAPDFTLPTLSGGEWSLAAHRGTPLTLLFSDPSCPPCAALLHALGPRVSQGIVLISRGDPGENQQLIEATGITAPVLLQRQREVARLYRILETPAVCQIDEQGNIAAGPIIGKAAVMDLLMSVGSGTMAVTPAPRALPVASRRWRS